MWDITIYFNKTDGACVKNLMLKFHELKFAGFKILTYYAHDYICLEIKATSNIKQLKNYVQVLLVEEIVLLKKCQHFEKFIILDGSSEFGKALLKSLVFFEIENDYAYVLNKLDLNKDIVVDSFFEFKCNLLKYKWEELIKLTNSNSKFLNDKEVYIEFISFLLSSVSSNCFSVDLTYTNNNYVLQDTINNVTKTIKADNEEGLISNLIMLAPKQINVYCVDNISNSAFKLIYKIFNKKVNLLV